MKLIYHILIRLSWALVAVLTLWAVLFYVAMINEVNDEMDDSLEDYAETIIIRHLAGAELPSQDNGTNNQYYLRKVDKEYTVRRPRIAYADSMVYIREKGETEPARILTTLFEDADGTYQELTVSVPSIEKDDLKQAILGWIVFLYVALLLVIISINAWLFQRNLKPLYTLLHWLDDYRTGDKNRPLDNDTTVTEFRKLNEAALRNAERNEELFEQQKQFIGNASHELQTPLAICRNRLEMFMEDESLSEVQVEELAKTHQTLEHLIRLNKSLLLLSKIDNGQFPEVKNLSLNDIVKQYLADYQEVYAHRTIRVSLEERGMLTLPMNESLATALITNLLKNAFVHNAEGGTIHIELSEHQFLIRNTGILQKLDENHLFERFYQGSKKEGSTGLGLAIADAICRLYHLRLRYFYREGEHIFVISR